jgi:uncharacterized protein YndB with AHSA1/START domain
MTGIHIAIATAKIHAPADDVWKALTDPVLIKEYMFGSEVTSDWEVGSTITYAGVYEGTEYVDHGRILDLKPSTLLRMTHFSPLGGREDIPENYHTLTWTLAPDGEKTRVTLTQDNNESEDAARHSENNWHTVLKGLKKVVEARQTGHQ